MAGAVCRGSRRDAMRCTAMTVRSRASRQGGMNTLRCPWLCAAILLRSTVPAQDSPPPPGGFAITVVPDQPVTWSDGYRSLIDVYEPAVAPPATGWPGVLALHGGGGHRRIPRNRSDRDLPRGARLRRLRVRHPRRRADAGAEPGLADAAHRGAPVARRSRDPRHRAGPGARLGRRRAARDHRHVARRQPVAEGRGVLRPPLPLTGYVAVHPTIRAAAPAIASVDSVGANVPGGLLVGDEPVEGRPSGDPVVQMPDVEDYAGILAWAQGSRTRRRCRTCRHRRCRCSSCSRGRTGSTSRTRRRRRSRRCRSRAGCCSAPAVTRCRTTRTRSWSRTSCAAAGSTATSRASRTASSRARTPSWRSSRMRRRTATRTPSGSTATPARAAGRRRRQLPGLPRRARRERRRAHGDALRAAARGVARRLRVHVRRGHAVGGGLRRSVRPGGAGRRAVRGGAALSCAAPPP